MGGLFYSWECGRMILYHASPGPNTKNDLKLALMRYRKEYQTTHIVEVVVSKVRNRYTKQYEVHNEIVATPTDSYQAQLEKERAVWSKKEEDEQLHFPYHRTPDKHKPKRLRKNPGRCKPELDDLELLEQVLTKPRCRYQRGWKQWYRPTAKTWHRHDDHKNWKTYRKTPWRI